MHRRRKTATAQSRRSRLTERSIAPNGRTAWTRPKGSALPAANLHRGHRQAGRDRSQDRENRRILSRPDAKFLNDIAADAKGDIYVSHSRPAPFGSRPAASLRSGLRTPGSEVSPMVSMVEGDELIVAAWGVPDRRVCAQVGPGNLSHGSLANKKISNLATPSRSVISMARADRRRVSRHRLGRRHGLTSIDVRSRNCSTSIGLRLTSATWRQRTMFVPMKKNAYKVGPLQQFCDKRRAR